MLGAFIYQYSRISTTFQKDGSGLQRQKEDTTKLITTLSKELNLPVYDKPLEDSGRSAFHGKHLEKGVFGVFLAAIERGEVKRGSVLVVESLDRLSRQSPNIAQGMMLQIINSGVRIYTTIDNTMYDGNEEPASLMMKLIMSILKFSAAHEESAKKSHRSKRNVEQSCVKFLNGDRSVIVLGGKPPAWMNADKTVKPDELRDVKEMIELRQKGYGYLSITQEVNKKYNFNKWAVNTVTAILKSRALYGERVVNASGTKYVLPDYYPVLMSKSEWLAIQPNNKPIYSTGEKNCIITGIGVTKCGSCGSGLVSRYYSSKKLFRIMCNSRFKYKTDCSISLNAYIAEFLVLQMCADKVWSKHEVDTYAIDEEIASTEIALNDLESNLSELDNIPLMFIKKVGTLEQKLEDLRNKREEMIAANISIDIDEWSNIPATLNEVIGLDNNQRVEIRGMIQNAIKSISITSKRKFYVVEVVFKDGEERRGCFIGRLPRPKVYLDIKSVNDKVKLRANGVLLVDHFDQLINGFNKPEVPASVLDLM
ncbi:recombinase family protein [Vibrio parahaemolyticus]|nr:recombinase family protein [Vibrio parahaemolyticus]EJG0012988.1 recombinase family protein [Vibrio parahaemolyticus]EJG0782062.1 recombinase family protein [Vibrio parahaemolyticus]EJS9799273.1 recombinase family protein [Vibrio parahaemolyticus]EJS9801418.1 recombinase family protein [Vibrio parahaemolyticus]